MTMFEWDEFKRQRNIATRDLDFFHATALFDGRPSVTIPAKTETEARFLTTGQMWEGKF